MIDTQYSRYRISPGRHVARVRRRDKRVVEKRPPRHDNDRDQETTRNDPPRGNNFDDFA